MGKIKEFCGKVKRKAVYASFALAGVACSIVPAFAAGDDNSAVTTALGTAFTSIKTDFSTALVAMLPVGLGIFAAIFLVRKAKSAFNAVAK